MTQLAVESNVALPLHEWTGPDRAPVIVVLGGISATRHVCANAHDRARGWWDEIVGPGAPIDTRARRVLSFDWLDGGLAPSGRPARLVTTHDQARALARLLDAAGVDRPHAIVGASYGGMVALAFAELFPRRTAALVVIGAAHEAHPMSTAIRGVQRRIVELGIETGRAADALALARELAMTTYRTAREFESRFASRPVLKDGARAEFPVEEYLRQHGQRFASQWRPERFLALSLSADLHRVDPAHISARTTLVAPEGDSVVPRSQMEELAASLRGSPWLVTLRSRTGHDAFLTEPHALGLILTSALNSRTAT